MYSSDKPTTGVGPGLDSKSNDINVSLGQYILFFFVLPPIGLVYRGFAVMLFVKFMTHTSQATMKYLVLGFLRGNGSTIVTYSNTS